jgi:hypothetical protein
MNDAFYLAFDAIEPTGKNHLLALDVSGSMSAAIAGMPLSCRDATAVLAMVTARAEKHWHVVGFTGGNGFSRSSTALTPLAISPKQRLDDVIRTISGLSFGGTDCALPIGHTVVEIVGLAILEHGHRHARDPVLLEQRPDAGIHHGAQGIGRRLVTGMSQTGPHQGGQSAPQDGLSLLHCMSPDCR